MKLYLVQTVTIVYNDIRGTDMHDNDVSDIVDLPDDSKAIGCKGFVRPKMIQEVMWAVKTRHNQEIYSTRKNDFNDTFSLVFGKFRIIIGLVGPFNLGLH